MLLLLADYLRASVRFAEAKELFEEAVEIDEQNKDSHPEHYITALNNFAVFLILIQDFAAAQRILEEILDLTLLWSVGGKSPGAVMPNPRYYEFWLHLNLVVLFVHVQELNFAAVHLQEADIRFGKLSTLPPQARDYYYVTRSLLQHELGKYKAAADDLNKVKYADNQFCRFVRAKLKLSSGEFSEAEQLLRKNLDEENKLFSAHRPECRDVMLELAESLLGQNKYDEAFVALTEACAITRDFALPAVLPWRKALANWLQRAQQLGRTADVAWLEADWYKASSAPEQVIEILPKFRIRSPVV